MTLDRLAAEAMQLSAEDRAELARRIFDSLEREVDMTGRGEVENAWLEEAERRYQRYLSGATQSVAAAEALGRVRESLRKE